MKTTFAASDLEQLVVALPGQLSDTEAELQHRMDVALAGREVMRRELDESYDAVSNGRFSRLVVTVERN